MGRSLLLSPCRNTCQQKSQLCTNGNHRVLHNPRLTASGKTVVVVLVAVLEEEEKAELAAREAQVHLMPKAMLRNMTSMNRSSHHMPFECNHFRPNFHPTSFGSTSTSGHFLHQNQQQGQHD